ncbi:MAG: hypothetical protein ACOCVN_02875 [bacterium]
MSINKILITCFLFINVVNSLKVSSQTSWPTDTITAINWPVDSLASIERAYILNKRLYNPFFVNIDTVIMPKNGIINEPDFGEGVLFANMFIYNPRITIRTTKTGKEHWPIFNYTSYSVLNKYAEPLIWFIESDSIFRHINSSFGFSRNFNISNELLLQIDTISYRQEAKERWRKHEAGKLTFDEVQKLVPYNKHIPYRNTRDIKSLESYFSYFSIPIFDKYRNVTSFRNSSLKVEEYWRKRSVSWDIAHLSERNYIVFLRTENCLISWSYYYPDLHKPEQHTDKQLHCYCKTESKPEVLSSDSLVAQGIDLDKYKKWIDFELLPDYKKAAYNAFADEEFFDGHFKAYSHNDNIYIINQKHGNIYFLGAYSIERIGRIEVENYKYKIDNIKVFIEDKDNNRIIVFAEVQWFASDYPIPPIISITDETQLVEILGRAVELVTKVE